MLLYMLLGLMGGIVALAAAAGAHTRRKAQQAATILRRMDERYEAYVQQQFQAPDEQLDWLPTAERLAQDALPILYADLSALLALVQTRHYSTIDIPYESQYFPTVTRWVEQHIPAPKNAPPLPTSTALQELKQAAQEAMTADLAQRMGGF